MEVFKKILGYFLMIIAILLALAVLATLPNSIATGFLKIKQEGTMGVAYFAGSLFTDAVCVLIVVFFIKKGLKLIKNKSDKSVNKIES